MYNILICDDERDIVSALKIYLSNDNYNLYEAYNGKEALDVINNNDIHLVLLDIMMPEMDGMQTLIKMRESKNIPVIFLSAKGEDTDKICELSGKILAKWRDYTDEEAFIFAETDGEPHNTITPIARMRDGKFELLLVRAPRDLLEISDCIRALQTQKYNCAMITFLSTSHLTVHASPDMCWSLDGERQEGSGKIFVENLHHAIRLIKRAD